MMGLAPGATFVDLGSGVGKACVAAHLVFPFARVVGVEKRQNLVDAGNAVLDRMKELGLLRRTPSGRPCGTIAYTCGDLEEWLSEENSNPNPNPNPSPLPNLNPDWRRT